MAFSQDSPPTEPASSRADGEIVESKKDWSLSRVSNSIFVALSRARFSFVRSAIPDFVISVLVPRFEPAIKFSLKVALSGVPSSNSSLNFNPAGRTRGDESSSDPILTLGFESAIKRFLKVALSGVPASDSGANFNPAGRTRGDESSSEDSMNNLRAAGGLFTLC
jgi:hypothetical protein